MSYCDGDHPSAAIGVRWPGWAWLLGLGLASCGARIALIVRWLR